MKICFILGFCHNYVEKKLPWSRSAIKNTKEKGGNQIPRYAILVNDMLNDFVDGKLRCERVGQLVPKIKSFIENARQKNVPLVYCNDEHLLQDTYEFKLWGPHAIKGSEGAKVVDQLKPARVDYVIPKRTYSSFKGTDLHKLLTTIYIGIGCNTVILLGVHTHICIKHTAFDAFVRGFNIIVAEDGVTAFTEQDHLSGLEYMNRNYGVSIKKISDITNSIS